LEQQEDLDLLLQFPARIGMGAEDLEFLQLRGDISVGDSEEPGRVPSTRCVRLIQHLVLHAPDRRQQARSLSL
jgi:hypothetical protein